MLHRSVHLLVVAALVSSGATAPFMHVHAHGGDHGHGPSSPHGEQVDEHCAQHHSHGAHWHLPADQSAGACDSRAFSNERHRHAAVALPAAAIQTSAVAVDVSPAIVQAPEAGIPAGPLGAHTSVDPTTGPDPPPGSVAAARAPPARS